MWGYFNDALNNALVYTLLGYINIWSGANDTVEGKGSATLSGNIALLKRFGSLLKTKACRPQVCDACNESKGEYIDLHEKYVAEEIIEEASKGVEK